MILARIAYLVGLLIPNDFCNPLLSIRHILVRSVVHRVLVDQPIFGLYLALVRLFWALLHRRLVLRLRQITLGHHLIVWIALASWGSFARLDLELVLNLLMQAIVGFLAEVLAGIVLRHGLVLSWRVLGHEVAQVLVVPCVLTCRYKNIFD